MRLVGMLDFEVEENCLFNVVSCKVVSFVIDC